MFEGECSGDYWEYLDVEPEARAAWLERCMLPLFSWLEQRAAPHVRQLTVELAPVAAAESEEADEANEAVGAALRTVLRACTALEHLVLDWSSSLQLSGADFGAPGALRSLQLMSYQ